MNRNVILFLLCTALLFACFGCNLPRNQRFERIYYDVFDTVTKLSGYAESESAFGEQADKVYAQLHTYHVLFDIYHDAPSGTNLKAINDAAGGDPIAVDPQIIDLLLFAKEVDEQTNHRVNVTLGAVTKLWHDAREAALADPEHAVLPDAQLLREAARHTGFDKLELDESAGTVRLTDPLARLDVGAIAKGYVAQKVSEQLPNGYLLSLGGNVVAKGTKPGGSAWTIGIQDPDEPSALLHTIRAENLAIVTSGDYQRVFTINGISYHHIIDPDTLMPAMRWRAVTVLCEDSAVADMLSTALFLMDYETGSSLAKRYGADAIWIAPGGTEYRTDGFGAYQKN